jgi:hypothetical protein
MFDRKIEIEMVQRQDLHLIYLRSISIRFPHLHSNISSMGIDYKQPL